MLLPAHLSIGELNGAEVCVFALLVGALLFVIAKAQCLIAMLGGGLAAQLPAWGHLGSWRWLG